jgi:phosphoenolpyruvate-protein kinase (PTS system EI component)
MVVGIGDELLRLTDAGTPIVVDGDAGTATVAPGAEARRRAHAAAAARRRERERSLAERALPAETVDGRRIRVLANVATASEVGVALPAGAEGVGLLRTELAFMNASGWPTEDEHRRALAPVLAPLGDMVATVRLLDFGGDKTPPFLAGTDERGIALLLSAPDALAAQTAALAATGAHTRLRVLLPMVEDPAQIAAVREAFAASSDATFGASSDATFGAMIETAAAVERVDAIAAAADFLSIGTNDLTHSVLATDRFAPGETAAHHPRVLAAIDAVVRSGHAHGLVVEVCGEAASNPVAMPLLLGLGVDELSVGAARVGQVRRWVRASRYEDARRVAEDALKLDSAAEVARLLGEAGDATAERVEGDVGVVPVGRQA